MNIFRISEDQTTCAEALCDLRLNKMILETGQLLSNAVRIHHPFWAEEVGVYNLTHTKHPLTLWVAESLANYEWTLSYLQALLVERMWRTNKGHKTSTILNALVDSRWLFIGDELSPQPNCTLFKSMPLHQAYKQALRWKWKNDLRPPKWTNRGEPEWRNQNV